MKYVLLLLSVFFSSLSAVTADELVGIHKVTTTEMNSINTPQAGSLVFNTTVNTIFFYTGTVWNRLRAEGSETVINARGQMTITGSGSNTTPYVIGK